MKGAIFLVSLLVCLSMTEAFSVKKWGRHQAKAVRHVQKTLFAKSAAKGELKNNSSSKELNLTEVDFVLKSLKEWIPENSIIDQYETNPNPRYIPP